MRLKDAILNLIDNALAAMPQGGALSIADRAVVLNVGRVVADAPAAELAQDDALRHTYLGF